MWTYLTHRSLKKKILTIIVVHLIVRFSQKITHHEGHLNADFKRAMSDLLARIKMEQV